ncbi:MAG TPA: sulfurtransferase complex subunit TusB [Beijerinckiaceae bacterium]|nr:sulfurtransferase complex subunit TusB [Beijerinckiaceae bacterium]
MSTLHTVNKSPFERNSLSSCLGHCKPGDAVLLIEDAVVGARKGGSFAGRLAEAGKQCSMYALGPDLAARGLKPEDMDACVQVVDYGGFVDLAAEHARTQAWL